MGDASDQPSREAFECRVRGRFITTALEGFWRNPRVGHAALLRPGMPSGRLPASARRGGRGHSPPSLGRARPPPPQPTGADATTGGAAPQRSGLNPHEGLGLFVTTSGDCNLAIDTKVAERTARVVDDPGGGPRRVPPSRAACSAHPLRHARVRHHTLAIYVERRRETIDATLPPPSRRRIRTDSHLDRICGRNASSAI